MFSSRLAWTSEPNRLSRLLAAKRLARAEVLDLTESNPTRAALDYPARQILDALASPASLIYTPEAAGLAHARAAVSEYYGGHVTPDRILLTSSTSEAYAMLFKLLADPGGEVLVPRPSYPLFEYLAALEGVQTVTYPLEYDGRWRMDVSALLRSCTSRTRAVVVVHPNNPTGSFVSRTGSAELLERCAERGVAVIADEVFADYAFVPDGARLHSFTACNQSLSFSLSGLSKISALPQMKAAWIVVNGPADNRAGAMHRLEWIADTYLSVSAPVQHALPTMLDARRQLQAQIRARTAANLAWLRAATGGAACRPMHVEGGWYAVLEVPRVRSEEEWAVALLAECNVLVQPGYFYDFDREAFLVLSLLTPEEIFHEGVARILTLPES